MGCGSSVVANETEFFQIQVIFNRCYCTRNSDDDNEKILICPFITVKICMCILITKVNKTWDRAMTTLVVKRGDRYDDKNLVVRRSGWKTVRVFVSSTFKDFHPERETLVKKVVMVITL